MRKPSKYERSPTLETVMMIEATIKKHSGEFNRTQFWKKLPRKVMWQTYIVAIDYLLSTLKIAADRKGHLCYIWNPKLAKRYRNRKDLEWKDDHKD